MKNLCLCTVCLILLACMVSCGTKENKVLETSSENTIQEEMEPFEIPRVSGEWPRACEILLGDLSDWPFQVGDVVDRLQIFCTHNMDLYDGMHNYDVDVRVEDDTIMKIFFDKEKLMDGLEDDGITVVCLKAGTTRIRVKMTYRPTGGTYATYATVTVTDPVTRGDWPDAVNLGFGSQTYECQTGKLFDDFEIVSLGNTDHPYGLENYHIEVKTQDPDILEVISLDKYGIFKNKDEGILIVRGLKPGTTTLTVTMTYIPTGGSEDTTTTVKVVEANDEETAPVVDESGDVWKVRIIPAVAQYIYKVQTGETFDLFEISFECSDCKSQYHPTYCDYHGIGYDYDDYRFDVVSENPEILEIVSYNKYTIMNAELTGGITVKGLKAGATGIQLTMTHIPTGKTLTVDAAVEVTDSGA
ncbi:MAG: hypothetical protein E7661_02865 [Ruminococcaceae bacterium]|nr:hypothetical protein [Oscillospiraceae bacterium]